MNDSEPEILLTEVADDQGDHTSNLSSNAVLDLLRSLDVPPDADDNPTRANGDQTVFAPLATAAHIRRPMTPPRGTPTPLPEPTPAPRREPVITCELVFCVDGRPVSRVRPDGDVMAALLKAYQSSQSR
jgi:hypothetical protein